MTNIFKKFLFLILIALSSHCPTLLADNITFHQKRANLINELEKDLSNIGEIIDDKIYIKPGSIYVSQSHIFLNFRSILIPVSHLLTDANGVYIPLGDLMAGFWGDTWICPNPDCGYENYEAVNFCGICGTRKPRR
ncbi:conserved putative secreted protein (plasmid) [Candidatus Protochlamydia naegleriophila]|uniref:Conserved putative secreted protein n=1 Tax=Candidatus Protochlamydia naegleriophila TaxID=389348 RepID=A0A0U5K7E6_9BACT|nr:hypothetical protein [Candidatus Protochlamydia naegleriophila]CUI18123.1 conserved putative secreted protein [Candidatus Protochlamydia naegleriophila]